MLYLVELFILIRSRYLRTVTFKELQCNLTLMMGLYAEIKIVYNVWAACGFPSQKYH